MYRVARSISVRTWMSIYTCIYSRDRGIRERAISNLAGKSLIRDYNEFATLNSVLIIRSIIPCIRNSLKLIVIDFRENIKGWNLGIILFVDR